MKVLELCEKLKLSYEGNGSLKIVSINTLEQAKDGDLAFLFEEKYFSLIQRTKASCLVISNKFKIENKNFTYIISEHPKLTMAKILELFDYSKQLTNSISERAVISKTALISDNVEIQALAYLGEKVVIGAKVKVFPNVYIGDNSVIGENTIIYPNVTIYPNTIIGSNVIIHSGTVIGSDGYGFVQINHNEHYKIPQLGNVVIEDHVEIGSNVSIDKATLGSTIIGEGAKIDNLVHIAHNVIIGKRTLIVAQVGIAGSSKIGNDCVIAGQAGISGHLEIGNQVMILGKSGVTKNIPDKAKVSGFPARNHLEELKRHSMSNKISELFDEIKELKKKLE